MRVSQAREGLQVSIDARHCRLPQAEIDRMNTALDTLGRKAEAFPVSDLRILVEYNARNNDFSVKTTLILPGQTLVCNDHDVQPYTAFERCVENLLRVLAEYKDKLGQVSDQQKQEKGTQHGVLPDHLPDGAAIDAAVGEGDYAAFREATLSYEEPLRKRVGRWVERYPEVAAQLGARLTLADVVEEVFLDAFEGYEKRPREVRLGDWLERLIDPAVKELLSHTDAELENVRMARSARGVAPTREEK
jgi:ribosome-associated translation inhibitor RaiA